MSRFGWDPLVHPEASYIIYELKIVSMFSASSIYLWRFSQFEQYLASQHIYVLQTLSITNI